MARAPNPKGHPEAPAGGDESLPDADELTSDDGIARAREHMASTGRSLGVAVRLMWDDTREMPLGEGICAKVVVTDGSTDYAPQTPVYVVRGRMSHFDAADLEEELELIAREWENASQAKELATAIEENRLVGALEEFGLGNPRR